MTCTITTNDFLLTNLDDTQLISIPSSFTSIEVDFLKQLLQNKSESFDNNSLDRSHSDFRKIIVDFGQTTFINNDGLIGLCQILRFVRDKKIDLTFISFSPQVRMVLSLVDLEHFFSIENSTSLTVSS